MKYARELIYGAVGYVAGVAVLRTLPRATMPIGFDGRAAAFALGSMIVFGALAWWVARRRPHGERLASGAAMALPVLLGDALETATFGLVYPNFDPASSGVFASILLFTNLAIVGGGWLAERSGGRVEVVRA